jgi:hypothetical protein
MRHTALALLTCAGIALPGAVTAQSFRDDVLSQVNRVRDGEVRMTFPLRPGVCGDGINVWRGNDRSSVSWSSGRERSRDVEYDLDCDTGPGRLVVVRREGETTDLRFYVGGRWRASDAENIGTVSARSAADYLLRLAETHDGKAGREAIFPATMVDSVTIWPSLMRIARSDSRPTSTRQQAIFWLGQLAEEPATRGLSELVGDNAVDREVRESAIFALSQRRGEGITALINVVRTSRDPELRKKALFWLANSRDPRALDLIEELLNKR